MKHIFTLLISVLLVGGCALNPQGKSELETSSKTVAESGDLPQNLWKELNQADTGTQLILSQHNVVLGRMYTSASGSSCRQLHWVGREFASSQYKIACKSRNDEKWYQVNPITESQTAFYELVSRSQ